jgi:lipopolysaccharide transport system ATP-binding protein
MIVERTQQLAPGQPLVELRHVARHFSKRSHHNRSFQDIFIRFFRRQDGNSLDSKDDFWPLQDVSLSISAGDCVGVIGPNGSGKSTLLKLITGILEPTRGELYVRGRISSLLELGAGFHPDLSGRENIFLNGSIYGLQRSQMKALLPQIIEYAELGDFIDTPVKHYSSGMYVRLGFAVAIFTRPDLLLVDEVLAVGDATFQRKCLQSIQDFRSQGGTLLFVSHDLDAIQRICKQVIWINDGQIQAQGQPTDVVMSYLEHLATKEAQKKVALERAEGSAQSASQSGGQARRWGTQRVTIRKVELLDGSGSARTTFQNGEPMTICLHYSAREAVEKPVFGLAIYHENGAHISGPNTRFGGLEIHQANSSGIVRYSLPALPMLEGRYFISVSAVNSLDTETYDYHDRVYTFQVHPGQARERYGLFDLGGVWQHEAGDHLSVPPMAEGTGEVLHAHVL